MGGMKERSHVTGAHKVAVGQEKEEGLGSGDVAAIMYYINLRARLDKVKDTLGSLGARLG